MYYFVYFSVIGTLCAGTTWLLLSQENLQVYDCKEILFY